MNELAERLAYICGDANAALDYVDDFSDDVNMVPLPVLELLTENVRTDSDLNVLLFDLCDLADGII